MDNHRNGGDNAPPGGRGGKRTPALHEPGTEGELEKAEGDAAEAKGDGAGAEGDAAEAKGDGAEGGGTEAKGAGAEAGGTEAVRLEAGVEHPGPEAQGPRLIAGLGASAGGLEALEAVLDATPPSTGIAFVVVSHQYPRAESLMPELLQRHTRMKVATAQDGMSVEPDHVYVAPPSGYLTLADGVLKLSEAEATQRRHLPIDRFFRSLGEAAGQRAACVVLSGSGTDGTVGLKTVKSQLGLAIAQDPDTAKYGGMPTSAINTRQVDHVLPPGEVATTLVSYADALHGPRLASVETRQREVPDVVGQILMVVRAHTGHDFAVYKQSTIGRRIDRRMAVHRLGEARDYLEYLRTHPEEIETLFHELLIGVTSFFRDPEAFETLKRDALERMLKGKQPGEPVRVWVTGCSTGEEAYSFAIVLRELMDELGVRHETQIFATDIDESAITTARAGAYPIGIAEDVNPSRLSRFFVSDNGHYRVAREIRDMVVFAVQNVLSDPPFTRLDLLSCRNLLIYLDTKIQSELLPIFHYALAPYGVLFIGTAETLGPAAEDFEVVSKRWNIYRRKPGRPSRRLTHLPVAALEGVQAREPEPRATARGMGDLSERMLAQTVVPPSVIIDEHGQIYHVHGRTGRYLEPSPGEPEMNLFRMARQGLRPELMSALRQAARHGEPVARRHIRVRSEGESVHVDLHVRPVREPKAASGYFVVTFEERPDEEAGGEGAEAAPVDARDERVRQLESELQATKQTLQGTVEEYETANEQLKSSNEELQSSNEELQSTNEELETAKEEQQSLNEELQTVNAELQEKMDRLGRVHDDMRNLLNSTDIATLFLDRDLHIKRFTPQATKVANLIDSDVGRPIFDLVTKLDYGSLAEDATEVLHDLQPKQTEVRGEDGTWYQMRMMPYRTSKDVIDGIVLTFVDVTGLKHAEQERERERAAVRNVVNEVPSPALVLDQALVVTVANDRFLDEVGKQRGQVEGCALADLGPEWGDPKLRELIGRRAAEEGVVEDRIELELPRLGRRALALAARRIDEPGAEPSDGMRVLLTLRSDGGGIDTSGEEGGGG